MSHVNILWNIKYKIKSISKRKTEIWQKVLKLNYLYYLLSGPDGKKQLGRFRCRWEDNIKMEFRKIG
jgi:hypothetical protein